MTKLTRFDPFGDLVRFDPFRGFDDLLRPMRLGTLPAYRTFAVEPDMKMDLTEDDRAYTVKAEIPGVKKEDIHVAVDGNEVTITAEAKKETEEKKGETVLRNERYYGRVARAFTLNHVLDEAKVEAKYNNGVLTLMLPKKGGPTVKEVAIN